MISHPDPLEASGVANPLALLNPVPAPDSTAPDGTRAPKSTPRQVETALLGTVQRRLATGPVVRVARGMSLFGEHAAGWLGLGLLGAAVDRRRRREWLYAAGGVAAAHGASIMVKRVVRRPRPDDPSIEVLAGTPSQLSFPSSHASSTTAAALLFGALLGRRARRGLPSALVPAMLLSRLVLGVHFPSDVLAGSALGATVATVTSRFAGRRRAARSEKP